MFKINQCKSSTFCIYSIDIDTFTVKGAFIIHNHDIKKILIVEDNKKQREFLIKTALSINPHLDIKSTDSIKQAIKIANNHKIQVFFIDINLIDGNGLDLAFKLRESKEYKFTPIIFITGIVSKELEAFHKIHCYDYITKPFLVNTLREVLKNVLIHYLEESNTKEDKYLPLEFKGIKQKILMSDICYIESRKRRLIIVTKYEEIMYKHISLKKFKEELTNKFIQIHQSFIVNMNYIKKIDMSESNVELKNICELFPIGVSYRKNVKGIISEHI